MSEIVKTPKIVDVRKYSLKDGGAIAVEHYTVVVIKYIIKK